MVSLTPRAATLQRRVSNPMLFAGWSLAKLPAALFAGVRLDELTPERCKTSVPYGWRSQNPFRSTYFAAQAMAAELSTGAIGLLAVEHAEVPFSILITDMTASFGKKATSRAYFVCEDGTRAFEAVLGSKADGEARQFSMNTVGRMADGAEVSRFTFTWSVKRRR